MNPWQQPPSQPSWGGSGGQYPFNTPSGGQYPFNAPSGGQYPFNAPSGGLPPGYLPQPSGATAITAAVLSFLGAAVNGLSALGSYLVFSGLFGYTRLDGSVTPYFVLSGVVLVAIAAGLITGGIMLLRRRLIARIIIAVSCGVVILWAIVGFIWSQSWLHSYGVYDVSGFGSGVFGLALNLIMPITTMTLALVPSTTRWCLAGSPNLTPQPPSPW